MSPLEIEILLHYYCRAEDHKDVINPPPSQKSAFREFVASGFLNDATPNGQPNSEKMRYSPTDKLYVYCDALCAVPEPRQEWVI